MSKVSVDFQIDNKSQSQSFQSDGILKDNTLIFHDEKKQKHRLTFKGDTLFYQRDGDPSFEFEFCEGQTTNGDYFVGDHSMSFSIQTHKFTHKNKAVSLTYTLKQQDIVVTHTELSLTYHYVQEA